MISDQRYAISLGPLVEQRVERLKHHKKLRLWGETMELVSFVYSMSNKLPREEDGGLKAQLRRSAISVPSNISERLTRKTAKDKAHFLNMAQASLGEIDAQVEISRRLGCISEMLETEANNKLSIVERLLSGLIRSVRE